MTQVHGAETSLTAGRPDVPSKPSKGKAAQRKKWLTRLPIIPAVAFMVVLTQAPTLLTLYYSFQRWILLTPNDRGFVGFDNYTAVLTDGNFLVAVLNTVVITSLSVILALFLGLIFALLLDRKFRGRGVVRTLLITPFLVMPAAGALVWKTSILDANFGLLNWVLSLFNVDNVEWVTRYPLLTVVAVLTWQWTPFMMLILLAGLQSQGEDILEAARIDGAGSIRIFTNLTWPHLRPYIELSTILGCVYLIQAFDPIYLITQGGPGNATTNLPYYLYLQTFGAGNIGKASAAGVLVVLGSIVVATAALRIVSSVFKEDPK